MSMVTNAINERNGNTPTNEASYFRTSASSYEEEIMKMMVKESLFNVRVSKIEKVYNKYINAAFLLRKQQLELNGVPCRVERLLHATAVGNVHSIVKSNLDWRMVSRARYGKGVSFSKNADYANFYSSITSGEKVFIVCDVLVKHAKVDRIYQDKICVPEQFDTFQSSNGYVYTKFDDYTFNPKFVIYYDQPSRESSQFYRVRRYHSIFDL